MYYKTMKILKSEDIGMSPKFEFWVYHIFRLMQIGSTDLLYNKKPNLPLIKQENMYEKMNNCHTSVGHPGRDKTWNEVNKSIKAFCYIFHFK